jgi:pimeloyl-ACP methyl ester carboxylesterase
MATIDIDGSTLFYLEAGSGQPVVFVHGIPTDYRAWNAQVEAFSKKYRAVSYSRRYASPNVRIGDVSDSTIQNNAADLKTLINRLGIAPINLIGHSYGGFIAAYLAANEPDLVRSLVLVEAAVSPLLVKNPNNPLELLALLLSSPSVASSVSGFRSKALNPALKALEEGKPELSVELLNDGIQGESGSFRKLSADAQKMMNENAKTIAELKTKFPVFARGECGRIRSKTLVVNGELSPLWLRRIGERLASSIPRAESAKIGKAHHFPHIENPAEFNTRVLDFLGRES